MRRWNGWGEEDVDYSLSPAGLSFLIERIGAGDRTPDVGLEDVLARVPASRLPAHRLVTDSSSDRLLHARGQSLPDWIALRSGRVGLFSDGVAYPQSAEDIRELMRFGAEQDLILIPYGGGTSVVGHINPIPGDRPVLTIDMRRMSALKELDELSGLATFEAGITGPEIEQKLRASGFTLGHYPQSFEYSTLGGWIATRSSGQQSRHYGRIEQLLAGVEVEAPEGRILIPPLPASAAGPDLRHIVLGSEGILGVITEAIVRVQPLPESDAFYGIIFHDWESGIDALRIIAQSEIPVSMLRLSDPLETEMNLILGASPDLAKWADLGLRTLRFRDDRSLLIFAVTGLASQSRHSRRQVCSIARRHGGFYTGGFIGRQWQKNRFRAPYLRNNLWKQGYAVDTLETAVPWSAVPDTARLLKSSLRDVLAGEGINVLAFCHLSHVYRDGASIYVTFVFGRSPDPDQTLEHWSALKQAASRLIVEQRGTISHQHGVGIDHAPYLEAEKSGLGMSAIAAVRDELDPGNMMNPGKLLAAGRQSQHPKGA